MNSAFNDFYRGKRVLVTGHTGFKGSWLSIWLKELGAEVIGCSIAPPGQPSNFEACRLKDRVHHIHQDIRDYEGIRAIFETHEPEVVFHLAAQPIVRLSYLEPMRTLDTNIRGTFHILEAIRTTSCTKVLVNITSDKCYKNREQVWGYRESDPMGGFEPYSASKGSCELVFASYLNSFFNGGTNGGREIGAVSVRAGNVIGGGDWGVDRLIPDCVKAFSEGRALAIRSPRAVRPWLHVLEPLSGYLWLGTLLGQFPERYSGSWNFGPHDTEYLNVKEIIEMFTGFWGKGEWEDVSTPLPDGDTALDFHESEMLKLCCDKARSYLKWYSILSPETYLRLTAEWYRVFYESPRQRDMHAVCVDQIHHYTEKAREIGLLWARGIDFTPGT